MAMGRRRDDAADAELPMHRETGGERAIVHCLHV